MTLDIVPEWFPKDKVCIVGHGQTEYTRLGQIGRPQFTLALEAILKAIDDAGLKVHDIDGLCTYGDDRSDAPTLATALGLPQMRFSNLFWGGGGGGASGAVMNAVLGVAFGATSYVVAYRSFARTGEPVPAEGSRVSGGFFANQAFNAPWGAFTEAHESAFQAKRHMHLYGTQSRHFGMVSVACYKHAQRNSKAVMYGYPLTLEEHQKSRIIVEPLRVYDYPVETDGAAAIVLTSVERARDLRQRPVYVVSASQGSGFLQAAGAYNKADFDTANFAKVAQDLWVRAGLTPKDIDVAQIYENASAMALMSIEDHGFCKRGEGGAFVEGGRLEWPSGALPFNTSGGNIAEVYLHGFELVIEGVRQMRGTSTCQVEDAEICLIASGPGVSPVSNMIIRR